MTPFALLRHMRETGEIRAEWDGGTLKTWGWHSSRDIPDALMAELQAHQHALQALIEETYCPTLDDVCPAYLVLKKRKDGIKAVWYAPGGRQAKIFLNPGRKRGTRR